MGLRKGGYCGPSLFSAPNYYFLYCHVLAKQRTRQTRQTSVPATGLYFRRRAKLSRRVTTATCTGTCTEPLLDQRKQAILPSVYCVYRKSREHPPESDIIGGGRRVTHSFIRGFWGPTRCHDATRGHEISRDVTRCYNKYLFRRMTEHP